MAPEKAEPHPFDTFTDFMRKLITVPKSEVDKLRAKEDAARAKKKRAKKPAH